MIFRFHFIYRLNYFDNGGLYCSTTELEMRETHRAPGISLEMES